MVATIIWKEIKFCKLYYQEVILRYVIKIIFIIIASQEEPQLQLALYILFPKPSCVKFVSTQQWATLYKNSTMKKLNHR